MNQPALALPDSIDNIDVRSWETFQPYFEELIARPLDDSNVRQWLGDWSHLQRLVREAFAVTYIRRSLDTTNEAYEAAFLDMVENVMPELSRADQQLKQRLLQFDLADEDLAIMLRDLRSEADLFCEENIPLFAEMTKLSTRYDKITSAMSADWDGEQLNLNQLGQHMDSQDRAERKRAWLLIVGLWQESRAELDQLYVELLELRQRIAANAGLSDFREYAFRQRKRFAYTPADCFQFHDAIEKAFVPAAQRIMQRKRQQLGYDSIRPWDWSPETATYVDTFDEPLRPFRTEQELVEHSGNIFDHLDPQLGGYFTQMAQDELLDLMTRQGKALGGYCSSLPLRKKTFIFMNGTGSAGNVRTMLHEAGHAFHGFEAMQQQPLVWQQRSPMEFSEVASMAMELLAGPYLTHEYGGFFDEKAAAEFRIQHLEKIILFMPFMAVVDSFQHWVYTHVDEASDPRALDAKWDELWQRYLAGVDWAGYEEVRRSGWHRKQHIFRSPFYYIEYGMAQIGALQIWRNAMDDHADALRRYREALALGGTRTLPELFEAAGAQFRFDTEYIAGLVDLIEAQLGDLYQIIEQ